MNSTYLRSIQLLLQLLACLTCLVKVLLRLAPLSLNFMLPLCPRLLPLLEPLC